MVIALFCIAGYIYLVHNAGGGVGEIIVGSVIILFCGVIYAINRRGY